MCNVFSLFLPSFFHVLTNNFFFFCKFLPFYFWNFGEPTVYRILCVEFPPPKFNAFQVFYRKMNAFGFCESCLFSSNIIDLPSFFYKTVPVYHEINADWTLERMFVFRRREKKESTVEGKIVCSIGILKNHIIILLVQVKIERFWSQKVPFRSQQTVRGFISRPSHGK